MLLKIIILLLVLLSLFSLFYALKSLFGKRDDQVAYARALSWRIGICLLLFLLLFIGFAMGWISPHGLPSA